MINTALDFYDDLNASTLRAKFPDHGKIPDFVKTAERLTPEVMDTLPDSNFALVMLDGTEKMRKFACTDKGNTTLSVIYFLENCDLLPAEAQKTAAVNLVEACGWYDIKPPLMLEKIALLGAAMNIATMGSQISSGIGKHKKTMQAVKAGVPAAQAMKTSELTGSHIMPMSAPPVEKKASVMRPYVEVTGQSAPVRVVQEAEAEHHCMVKEGQARYPIDTMSQVEQAAAYFLQNMDGFEPCERHQYCVKLAARAHDMGLGLDSTIEKYGSTTFAPDLPVAIYSRMRYTREGTSERGLLEEMRQKYAGYKAEPFAVALEHFDKRFGLDSMWGKEIPDPYFSTFGVTKTAEWSYTDRNDTINETRLRRCISDPKCKSDIKEHFGEEVCAELAKSPVQIFDSLPADSKRIIMRLGSQIEE